MEADPRHAFRKIVPEAGGLRLPRSHHRRIARLDDGSLPMISHDKHFIFIHIPKTAGTSVQRTLLPHGRVLQGPANYDSIYFKHITAASLQEKIGAEEFARHFSFTIVRNPWDWAVSNYLFRRGFHRPFVAGTRYKVGRPPLHVRLMGFGRWLEWWTRTLQPSQHAMIADRQGRVLVDLVGRFENLAEDFDRICARIGIEADSLPHANRQKRRDYREYYNARTRDIVARHFRTDIEAFDYDF